MCSWPREVPSPSPLSKPECAGNDRKQRIWGVGVMGDFREAFLQPAFLLWEACPAATT